MQATKVRTPLVVRIEVRGGIAEVVDVPSGVRVMVYDYDTIDHDPTDGAPLVDESGDECIVSVYGD